MNFNSLPLSSKLYQTYPSMRSQSSEFILNEDAKPLGDLIKNKTQPLIESSKKHSTESTIKHEPLLKFLVLETFKVLPCVIKVQHNHKQCPFFHYSKDRKRRGDFYSAELCEYIENNQICPYVDKCLKSHSCVEQLYRQDKYKTKFCSQYPHNTDNCEYGDFCSFAHNEEEILIELLHRLEKNEDFFMFKFKTVMCPFSSLPHDKAQCVYSHNWQDFRRKPNLFHYNPVACANWKFTNYIVNYVDGCAASGNCEKCHGWKELDYHPLVYKTKPCSNGPNCHRTFECPYFHHEEEKRNIDVRIQMNVFRYAPKNRMATLKKKNEPCVSSTNNLNLQNQLRKINHNEQSLNNNGSSSIGQISPIMGPIACSIKTNNICGLENKISPEKKDNYAIINTKKDDFFSSGMTFSQFYPELINDFQIFDQKDHKEHSKIYERKHQTINISLNDDGITPFESGLSTKSHSSTETFLDVLYIN